MIGVGTETVGTDAGAAHSFDPAFPCHSYLMGNGKYGLTQLQHLARLPADRRRRRRRAAADRVRFGQPGAGAGPRRAGMSVDDAVGRTLAALGVEPGLRRRRVRQLPRHERPGRTAAAGSSPPATRAARRRWPTPTPA